MNQTTEEEISPEVRPQRPLNIFSSKLSIPQKLANAVGLYGIINALISFLLLFVPLPSFDVTTKFFFIISLIGLSKLFFLLGGWMIWRGLNTGWWFCMIALCTDLMLFLYPFVLMVINGSTAPGNILYSPIALMSTAGIVVLCLRPVRIVFNASVIHIRLAAWAGVLIAFLVMMLITA